MMGKLLTKFCKKCGKEFSKSKNRQFCSIGCSNACKPPQAKTGFVLNCAVCGKEFYVQKCVFDRGVARYCSKQCKGIGTRGEKSHNWKGGRKAVEKRVIPKKERAKKEKAKKVLEKKCPYCGKPFIRSRAKFCSVTCRSASYRQNGTNGTIEQSCAVCGKKYHVVPAVVNGGYGKTCSRECFKTYASENWVGDKNPKWRGGCKKYYGSNWVKQRRAARKRDGFTCQRCGITQDELGKSLDVHHITRFNAFDDPANANDLSNLISLCPPCHAYAEHHGVDWK